MKTTPFFGLLLGVALGGGGSLHAQTAEAPGTPTATASVPVGAFDRDTVVPDRTVYLQKLPTAEAISSSAAKEGLKVDRIEQSLTRVLAKFKTSDGRTQWVAYQLVPPPVAGMTDSVPVPSNATPKVVYRRPARVIYYDDYPYYGYAPYWGTSWSVGIGWGYRYGPRHFGRFRGCW